MLSYRRTIWTTYSAGGGSCIVARHDLGMLPGLTAAAAFMIDYVLTVAVIGGGWVAAITSLVPELPGTRPV